MPTPAETVSYQLGVRLIQCQDLCRTYQPREDDNDPPPGDEMSWIQHSFETLGEAFLAWGTVVSVARPRLDAPRELIAECLRLWQNRRRVPTRELLKYLADVPIVDRLKRLEGHILRMLAKRDPNGGNPELWFKLGFQICDGCMDWHNGPQETSRRSLEWVWLDREELNRSIEAAGTSLDALCPEANSEQDDLQLPYLSDEYAMWNRLEAGLRRLLSRCAVQSATGEPVNCPEAMEPASPIPPADSTTNNDFKQLMKIKGAIAPNDVYIGQSMPILRMFKTIADFNQVPESPILLLGPTGVGKTELAKLIHDHAKPKGTFVVEQATSTMSADQGIVRERWVGYAKGSTVHGAKREGSDGLLSECRNGTIFFDELHHTRRWFQAFLLQVLDGRDISLAHGEPSWVKPEVRMIFASNRSLSDLESIIEHDLLARLSRWIVEVPPLNERKEDIVLFADKWCEGRRRDYRFLLALLRYDWPGNVRELRDVLRQATAQKSSSELGLEDLKLNDMSVIEEIRQIPEEQVMGEVLQFLVQTLAAQGLQKGKGLQKRLAQLLQRSEGAVSKHLRELHCR